MDTHSRKLTRIVLTAALVGAGTAVAAPAQADVDAGSACAGVDACASVASVDVDGDGLFDDVALAPTGGPGTQEVRVLTSTGQLATYQVPVDDHSHEPPYSGAARIDDRPGDDLVFTSSVGAHATFSTVLAFTDGYLVEVPAPGSSAMQEPGQTQWVVDGSISSNVGVTVEEPGVVTIRSAVTDWEPADAPVYEATQQTWSFSNGTWVSSGPVQESRPPVGTPLPQGFSGWHVSGLPTF